MVPARARAFLVPPPDLIRPLLIRGTVDLLILHALSREPKHGHAVSEWIQSETDETLFVEEGTLYPALHRLEGRGWIEVERAL